MSLLERPPMLADAVLDALVLHRHPLLRAGIATALSPFFRAHEFPADGVLPAWPSLSALPALPTPPPGIGAVALVIADHEGALQALAGLPRRGGPGLPAGGTHGAPGPHWLVVSPVTHGGRVRHAMAAGVLGYVHASCALEELRDAARAVAAGRRYLCRTAAGAVAEGWLGDDLTPRERDVLGMLCLGLDNKSIGLRLGVAAGTVKTHVKTLLQKLGARSRTQAATEALRRGLLDEPAIDEPMPRPMHAAPRGPARSVAQGLHGLHPLPAA
ncbi:response regulator transcription factor [Mitsuaria sp. GD03876]|uniref:response regulator transcription factor n=1 Tax=Mitsuaria sp. GD03876 TaxID=2975399 RepID=UPI00244D3CED|nr:response regulator transcription factor [Mitsuaria sp. GD03876]MDH0867736.1 response regulator transcription factor [Mitsuaria sp. GD03876]